MNPPTVASGAGYRTVLGSIVAMICASLLAQNAPTTKATTPTTADDETIRLDTFSVASKKDYGYRATNSITATGSGEAIINTPLSISVITKDFLDDKGITEMREAVRYVPSISSVTKEESEVYSRGFTAVLKMDGAEDGRAFTNYNAERIEVIKGPVSVLQGRASAGGVVNVYSRRPKFNEASEISASAGSFDYKIGRIMTTGPLVDRKVAYLFGYTKLEKRGWVERNYRNDDALQFAVELRPTEKLTINLDYQWMNRDELPQQHLTFTSPQFLAKELEGQRLYDVRGLARPADYPQYGELVATWMTRTPGVGPNAPTEVVNINELMYQTGYRANGQGPQAYRKMFTKKGFAEAKLQLASWLDWRSFYYQSFGELDQLVLGTFRPAGGLTIRGAGARTLTPEQRYDTSNEMVARVTALGTSHRILVGFQYRDIRNKNLSLNGATITWNPRMDPVRQLANEVAAANLNGFVDKLYDKGNEKSYYFVDQIAALNERVHAFIGGRHSDVAQSSAGGATLSSGRFTPQLGAVVKIPGVEGLSAYASYGESYRPNFIVDTYGKIVDPTVEKNKEVGLKFDMFDGKFSGTASVYKLEQTNVPARDFAQEAATGRSPIYNVSGLARSSGAEFEAIFSPVRNYQLVLGYARTWEALTVSAQDTRQNGTRLQNAPEFQFTFWNKYVFTTGPLKDIYVGAGSRYVGNNHLHPSWSAPIYGKTPWDTNLLLGYTFKVGKLNTDVSLRVENALDKFYFDETFRPNEPRRYYLNTRFKF